MDKIVNEEIEQEDNLQTKFANLYPELMEWLQRSPQDDRWKWSIASLSTQMADITRSEQKHALGRFFTQTKCHQMLKLLLIRNALQKIQIGSTLLGTGITEILCTMPTPPSKSTKERIIKDACDRGYCFKVLGRDNLQKVVPKPIMFYAHFVESRARLEVILGAESAQLALRVGKQMDGYSWMTEIDKLITDNEKKDLDWDAEIFDGHSCD